MSKLIKDGQVAVLVSRGYGSGWGSEGLNVFEPEIVEAILDGKSDRDIEAIAEDIYPNHYLGGLDGLEVQWVPVGTRFRIEEYDGAESLRLEHEYTWETA